MAEVRVAPEIRIGVESIDVVAHAAVPTLTFRLRLAETTGRLGQASGQTQALAGIDLHCQLMIEAPRRPHSVSERQRLDALFGRSVDASPVRSLLWTQARINVPAFERECLAELHVACSFDFNAAIARYFQALEAGDVPLRLQFSGTVFAYDDEGRLQIARIPWSTEAACALDIGTWQALRDRYYPNAAWLCLDRATFERLCDYRREEGLVSWEQALDHLLARAAEHDAAALEPVR